MAGTATYKARRVYIHTAARSWAEQHDILVVRCPAARSIFEGRGRNRVATAAHTEMLQGVVTGVVTTKLVVTT